MPTLKGKWYFKEILTYPESSILFEAPGAYFGVEAGEYPKQVISVNSYGSLLQFYDDTEWNGGRYIYSNEWSAIAEDDKIKLKTLIFLQPIDVPQDLYNWFTQNAVNLQPTGTWRFNKTLKLPAVTQQTGYNSLSASSSKTFCTVHDTDQGQVDAIRLHINVNTSTNGGISGLWSQDAEGNNCNMWTLDGDDEFWVSEDARLITFNDQLVQLYPDFAFWFYENAHSMELKLYSECYIAETADKIRECANDNTLTFKVSDLADGVQLAYDAGYSKGSSENSLDLEALGALCDWEIMTNYESYPIIAITNHHPTYYLKCTIQDIDGDSILDTEDDSEYPNGVVTVPPNSTTISVYIEYPFSDIDPITISDMRWTADE